MFLPHPHTLCIFTRVELWRLVTPIELALLVVSRIENLGANLDRKSESGGDRTSERLGM
jgi:hypothetical protein